MNEQNSTVNHEVEDTDNDLLVSLKNVYKVYDASGFAVRKINLDVKKGEAITLFGPNGAGKSTIARLIANSIKQTSGLIEYNFKQPNIFYAIGYQSREQNWPNGFRTKDITNLWISIYNIQDQGWIEKLKTIFGVDKIWKSNLQKTNIISLQLFGVFLAMLYRPELLVIDELSSAIDFETKQQIIVLLKEYVQAGNTLIMVQPDEYFVTNLASRMIYVSNGQIVDDQKSYELKNEFESMSQYLEVNGGHDNLERKKHASDLFKPVLNEFNDLYHDSNTLFSNKVQEELDSFNHSLGIEVKNMFFKLEKLKNALYEDARKPLINKEIYLTRKLIGQSCKVVDKTINKLSKVIHWPSQLHSKVKELVKSLSKIQKFLHQDLTNFYKHRRLLITGNSKLTRKQSEQLQILKEKYIREEMNTIRSERFKQSWQKVQTLITTTFSRKDKSNSDQGSAN